MVFDATNSRLITDSIKKLTEYEDYSKHIFIAYLFENYWSIKKSKRILLTLREIILQKQKMVVPFIDTLFKRFRINTSFSKCIASGGSLKIDSTKH